jgi:hypothetical protein
MRTAKRISDRVCSSGFGCLGDLGALRIYGAVAWSQISGNCIKIRLFMQHSDHALFTVNNGLLTNVYVYVHVEDTFVENVCLE